VPRVPAPPSRAHVAAKGTESTWAATTAQARALRRFTRLGLPVYCGAGRKRLVALTFDDGPGPYSERMIRILELGHAKATFFLVGKELAHWPGTPRRELSVAALGDHTWTHSYLPGLPAADLVRELRRPQQVIAGISGEPVRLFRPPYEATDATVAHKARALGMVEVLWSVDSTDSAPGANTARIARNVDRLVRPGSIVLLHENRGQTLAAVRYWILPFLARRHLQPVSVPELLASDPPGLARLRAGLRGCLQRARPSR